MHTAALLLTLAPFLAPHRSAAEEPAPGAAQEAPLPRRGALGLSFSPLARKAAEKAGLARGEGLVANEPTPGLTAAALSIQAGDVVLRLNGTPVASGTIGAAIRAIPAGSPIEFDVLRNEERLKLRGVLLEKPRDPGTDSYEVI
jgi:S1-C subfamily serine protease